MGNTGKFIVMLVGGLLAVSAVLVAVVIGLGGADREPVLRAANLATATDADVPDVYADAVNPFALTDADALAAGEQLANRRCRACHGPDLRGGRSGPADLVASGQTRSDAFLYWAISDGSQRGMPNWGRSMSEDERWQLITYLRSLGQ